MHSETDDRTETCPGCGQVFAYSWRYVTAPEACGHECYQRAERAKEERKRELKQARAALIADSLPPCNYCGGKIPAEVANHGVRYCSKDCSRGAMFARRYDMEPRDLHELRLTEPDGCHICGHVPGPGERRLAIDHCHTTSRVRGLLCFTCNTALGKFRDDPNMLRRAADYLEGSHAHLPPDLGLRAAHPHG